MKGALTEVKYELIYCHFLLLSDMDSKIMRLLMNVPVRHAFSFIGHNNDSLAERALRKMSSPGLLYVN